ncbi:ABC transporter family substrate-binding protein [Nonomuraea soli]|uniref:Peptide/nickel transport system substrate-binding protein n=1 Tax=Nonomuraea soli TaxID=1032476 RepID=A0A7W0CG08_9ACTN|nr:ABC transporter family substrate-binding protein [Nonomuraea soli]MBA2890517.1 peptide/nickel transport system substrate-binding protein [Nonomuraea soli]
MSNRKYAGLAAGLTAGVMLLSACGTSGESAAPSGSPSAATTETAGGAADTIAYAEAQEFNSFNSIAVNNLTNRMVMQNVLSGFWDFGEKGAVTPNTDFGTYEKTSDDPLTVKYTISDKAVWSDGTAIDCDDMLLWWIVKSGKGGDFQTDGTTGVELTKAPACDKGGKSFELVYSEPFADWDSNGPANNEVLPAHVIEKESGLSEDDFIAAVKAEDKAKLAPASKAWNTIWVIQGQLPATDKIPASGPYRIESMQAGQSVTMVANDKYWGTAPATKTLIQRVIPEDQQVQALQNGEVQAIEPQPNADLVKQLEGLQGIKVQTGSSFTYEHMDFNFDSSPFKDKALREAFALCVPRQLIVDNLIKPVAADSEPLKVRNVLPFESTYAAVSDAAGFDKYAQPDIAGAKAILEKAGKVGQEVKIGHIIPNPRRTSTVDLIRDSCEQAGFKVTDAGEENFFEADGGLNTNTYDVALFAWVGSGQVSGWSSTYRTVAQGKCDADHKANNSGCYSNKEVDKLINELNGTTDKSKHPAMINQIEKLLWEDLATIPLFAHPLVTAWDEKLQGVNPNPAQSTYVWNAETWTLGS